MMMAAKGPYNPLNTSLLVLLCCTLFITLHKKLLLLGSSVKGGADFLADRIGCAVDPIENECICRSDLQQTADSFLRKCVSDNCDANAIDVSRAVRIYDDYCTSNGYTRGCPRADDQDDSIIRYADRPCDRHGDCHADSPSVWGTTSAAGGLWAVVRRG